MDLWSVGCVLAECMGRQPLFPGHDERDMAQRIFSLLGTPTEEVWPGVAKLKLFNSYATSIGGYNVRSSLRQHFSHFEGNLVLDLLESLLTMNPMRRITAQEALRHPWFAASPPPKANAVILPREPRNEAWIKKKITEQEQKQRQQKYHKQPQQPKKRASSPVSSSTSTQPPPRKQMRTSS